MIPTLRTARLVLDGFRPEDGPDVQRLAGDWEVARTTQAIPHPYPDGAAERWIALHAEEYAAGTNAVFAVRRAEDGTLLGGISLKLELPRRLGVLGYWIGRPFWKQGYATEATRALLDHAFATWALERIEAHHLKINPASGRVMEKAGMRRLGEAMSSCRGPEPVAVVGYAITASSPPPR